MANPTLTTAPTDEPITLAEAKMHLRVTNTAENSQIERQITLARQYVESVARQQMNTATYTLYMDAFPAIIYPPMPPLQSVTHLKYYDTGNTLTTLTENTDFTVDTKNEPGRIEPEYGTSWPSTRDRFNAVELKYVAGFGDEATDVPNRYKQAMLLLIANWHENREPIIVGAVANELAQSVNALLLLEPNWSGAF